MWIIKLISRKGEWFTFCQDDKIIKLEEINVPKNFKYDFEARNYLLEHTKTVDKNHFYDYPEFLICNTKTKEEK